MSIKTSQLQIRLTEREKFELRRRANAAGESISTYVLKRVLPQPAEQLQQLLVALEAGESHRLVLADLNDLLMGLDSAEFSPTVELADVSGLPPWVQNYVAAMVDLAAHRKGVTPPGWTRRIEPLADPWFGTEVRALRPYLLRASPVPFKRRNLFIDASIGSRV